MLRMPRTNAEAFAPELVAVAFGGALHPRVLPKLLKKWADCWKELVTFDSFKTAGSWLNALLTGA